MKFYTRDKKPNIYNIGVISLIMLFIIAILIALKQHFLLALAVITYLLLVLYMLANAFIKQLQYNPYSYNAIFYSGFFLFVFSLLLVVMLITKQLISYPETYLIGNIISTFLSSATTFMIISFPFILVFSLALSISNIILIKKEGLSIYNVLGIILSFLLIVGEIFIFSYNYYASGSMMEVFYHDLFTNVLAAIYLYFECMMLGTIICNLIVVKHEPEYDKDYLIVLGCGLKEDGSPTPLLKGRVDRAISFYHKQKQVNDKDIYFIPSGGQGANEVISEAESMKRYLIDQGIDEKYIIKEDKSTNTYENMKFSKEIIKDYSNDIKVAFSTTNYHVFRSGVFANKVKMKAEGMGAKTKWYFWPNAAVREFVGLISKHRLKQTIIIVSMIVFYVLLTIYNYHFFY